MRIVDNQWFIDASFNFNTHYNLGMSMEPEVHIVDRYMQLVKGCFTMTNIMLEGGKEIDLLAGNPRSVEKYHVEVRVAIGKGFRLRIKDTQTKNGRKHRRGLDTLSAIKFEPPIVVNSVRRIFGSSDYKRVLVVWDVQSNEVVKQAKVVYGIEVWKMPDIIDQIMKRVETKAHRDDVLRTLQLVRLGQLSFQLNTKNRAR
jgi:hypothetical protein